MILDKSLQVDVSIEVQASQKTVWECITNPDIVKRYFFGTELNTSWELGSAMTFSGDFDGQSYKDKGIVQTFEPSSKLSYLYFSSFFGLADERENYAEVRYELKPQNDGILLSVTQIGFVNTEKQAHGEGGWKVILEGLKKEAEARS